MGSGGKRWRKPWAPRWGQEMNGVTLGPQLLQTLSRCLRVTSHFRKVPSDPVLREFSLKLAYICAETGELP